MLHSMQRRQREKRPVTARNRKLRLLVRSQRNIYVKSITNVQNPLFVGSHSLQHPLLPLFEQQPLLLPVWPGGVHHLRSCAAPLDTTQPTAQAAHAHGTMTHSNAFNWQNLPNTVLTICLPRLHEEVLVVDVAAPAQDATLQLRDVHQRRQALHTGT